MKQYIEFLVYDYKKRLMGKNIQIFVKGLSLTLPVVSPPRYLILIELATVMSSNKETMHISRIVEIIESVPFSVWLNK